MKLKTGIFVFIILLLSISPICYAGRAISLPFEEKFDSGDTWTSDLRWVANGATGTHITSGCWSGGCAKFTPPNSCSPNCTVANGTYSGLGQFTGFDTQRLNVRMLLYFGSTYLSTAETALESWGDKFIIAEPSHAMMGLNTLDGKAFMAFGIMHSDTSYWYEDLYGDWRDKSPNYSPVKVGSSGLLIGEWFCVEYELDFSNNTTTARIWNQSGTISGIYITTANNSDTHTTYIDIIGGYYNRVHLNQDANTYMLIDELKISNTYIGPPIGFVGGDTTPPTLSNLSPSSAQSCTSDPRDVAESLTTNEAATCRAHDTETLWANMTQMTTTGGTSHSRTVSRVCGTSYTPKVKCRDSAGNESDISIWNYGIPTVLITGASGRFKLN